MVRMVASLVMLTVVSSWVGVRAVRKVLVDISDSASARAVMEENSTRSAIDVEVVFVRHGHGCHNALSYQGRKGGLTYNSGRWHHCKFPDPPLTDCGVHNSKANGLLLKTKLKGWKPDFVASSNMIRAMETAVYMFPGDVVHPLPFLKEAASGLGSVLDFNVACNFAVEVAKQKEHIKAINAGKIGKKVDFRYIDGVADITFEDKGSKGKMWNGQDRGLGKFPKTQTLAKALGVQKPAYKLFRAFLAEKVIPSLLAKKKDSSPIKIVMVSHSNALTKKLKKYFKCKGTKGVPKGPKAGDFYFVNNAAKKFFYKYNKDNKQLEEVKPQPRDKKKETYAETSSCHDFGNVKVDWGKDQPYACPKDYKRCWIRDGGKYMGEETKDVGGRRSGFMMSLEDAQKKKKKEKLQCCTGGDAI